MNSDFDRALDDLCGTILDIGFSNFSSNDTIHPKTRHVLMNSLFSKNVREMKLKFDMTTRQKEDFGCFHMFNIFF